MAYLDHYAQTYAQFSWICSTFLFINLMGQGFCERMPHYLNLTPYLKELLIKVWSNPKGVFSDRY